MLIKMLVITFICSNITIGKNCQAVKPKNNFSAELISVDCSSIDEIVSNNTIVTNLESFDKLCNSLDKYRGEKFYAT